MRTWIIIVIALIVLAGGYFLFVNRAVAPNEPYQTATSTVGTGPASQASGTLTYINDEYRFEVTLPASWQGYTVVNGTWQGQGLGTSTASAQGPELSLRHPLYTAAEPRQDLPIMIFTKSQWADLQNEKFHIGAAPINPSRLGENDAYVFALPARYNYAFPTGYQEVEQIVASNTPLKTF